MLNMRLAVVLMGIILSSPVFAEVTGTYVIEAVGLPVDGPQAEVTLTINNDDEGKYSGVWKDRHGTVEIEEIKIDESKFSFSWKRDSPFGEVEMGFKGKFESGNMSGKMWDTDLGEDQSIEFIGKVKEEEATSEESDSET